jgi:menaquinol-cytochrome c reductase iron-sulfur subunit
MERRSFLKWATNGLGAVFGLILGVPAIAYLLDPRHRSAPGGDFKPVANLSELSIDEPRQVVIRAPRQDAWTLHTDDVIGRVWLIRRDEKKVDAYTTICPHLGGSINYDASARGFKCPLHNAEFNLACQRIAGPAPRDMDSLEVELEGDVVKVKYQNFYQGIPEKKPKA